MTLISIDINAKKEPVFMQCYGVMPTTSDLKKLTDVQIKARHKFLEAFEPIAIDTKEVNHVDVETSEKSAKYHEYTVTKMESQHPYFESVNRKLPYSPAEGNPHIFCKFEEPITKDRVQFKTRFDIEVLSGQ